MSIICLAIHPYTPVISGVNLPGVVEGAKLLVLSGWTYSHWMYVQTYQIMGIGM